MLPKLDQVTLCCIDTDHPGAGLRAVRLSQAQCQFARTLFLGPADFISRQTPGAEKIDFLPIPPFGKGPTYFRLLTGDLLELFSTSHVLIIEWDGYVLNGQCWNPEFLKFDYIGAVWAEFPPPYRVGNGGFSMRSRRFLEILSRPEIPALMPPDVAIDIAVCIGLRPMLEKEGIKFADEKTASHFSFELAEGPRPTFGFHGVFNLCQVVPPGELQALLDMLPPHNLEHRHTAHWIKGYAARNRWREALTVLQKIESTFSEQKVLEILSEIADYDLEKANAARHVIHGMGMSQEFPK